MTIMKPTIKVMLDPGAEMPHYAHTSDVGADVKALRTTLLTGNGAEYTLNTLEDCRKMRDFYVACAKLKIDTGIHVTPADGYYCELIPNSRIAKTPFMYANSYGVIDPEYTGSMRVVLNCVNNLTPDDLAQFLPGRVVGQIIVRKRISADFEKVEELEETERGDGGFGSTEKRLSCFSCKHMLGLHECQILTIPPVDMRGCPRHQFTERKEIK